MSGDDLALYLTPPVEPGPSQNVRWRQGTVVSFDQTTKRNVITVGGTSMVDLPLTGVTDTTPLIPGVQVGLLVIESTAGLTTYTILGRQDTPT